MVCACMIVVSFQNLLPKLQVLQLIFLGTQTTLMSFNFFEAAVDVNVMWWISPKLASDLELRAYK